MLEYKQQMFPSLVLKVVVEALISVVEVVAWVGKVMNDVIVVVG